jgi:hypothetical protein
VPGDAVGLGEALLLLALDLVNVGVQRRVRRAALEAHPSDHLQQLRQQTSPFEAGKSF